MKKETPRSLKREAGLADGLTTVAPDAGMPTTGRDQGKAQSERAKRGLRHTDPSVASSAQPSGAGSRIRMGQRRRLGSGQARSLEARERPGSAAMRAGAVRPLPSARALSNQQNISQRLQVLRFKTAEFEKEDWAMKATISEVQGVVAAVHGMTREQLKSRSRKWEISHPRQEAMYLARVLTGRSYPAIGYAFGDFDHTSILHGYRRIERLRQTDPKLAARLDQCRAAIAALVAERAAALGLTDGSSTEWSPPPPLQIAKPDRIRAAIDFASWQAIGGELEAAA